jgi:hypothetical protein
MVEVSVIMRVADITAPSGGLSAVRRCNDAFGGVWNLQRQANRYMEIPKERSQTNRVAELVPAILNFRTELLTASLGFRPESSTQARGCANNALVGVIKFVLHLFPNDPTSALPLNELLYGLEDLDHGKVTPLLEPARVPNNPGVSLSEDLFRATVAAGMSVMMTGRRMKRAEAARHVARGLSKIGCKHASGKAITPMQIGKWREKMMRERAAESRAVQRYQMVLKELAGKDPIQGASMLLDSLASVSPSNFPKKPPA